MSRFYDALKEVGRSPRRTDQSRAAALANDWGIPAIDIPAVQSSGAGTITPEDIEDVPGTTIEGADAAYDPIPPVEIPPAYIEPAPTRALGVPSTASLNRKARLIPHATDSAVVEYYRRLRTKILQKREEKPFKLLLVTSANPQEGKTVTVMNLGLSYAMLPGFKVLVVDGDFRRGSLGNWLGVPSSHPGLSNLIEGTANLEDVVLKSESVPMHFIVRGNSKAADVHVAQYETHFRRLAEAFDLVIVDSPPANLLADVQVLAASCDAVLLVARSFVTSRQALEKAARDLERFNVIGTVLNAAGDHRRRSYYGYYQGRA